MGLDQRVPTASELEQMRAWVREGVEAGAALGTRATFADIGETVADYYGVAGRCGRGISFLSEVREA